MGLNERGYEIAEDLIRRANEIDAVCHDRGGVRVLDCGVSTSGSAAAGTGMARVALGGAGTVSLLEPDEAGPATTAWPGCPWPTIRVASDHAVAACLAAQYAGWKVAVPGYFAMASGPKRLSLT